VYLSYARPDPSQIYSDQLLEEYRFPMAKGASWCPGKQEIAYLTPPAETPVPCAYAGMRMIENEEVHTTPAGTFDRCYRMEDAVNSGGVIQWFCDGVGVAGIKYDHGGTRFGFEQELVSYTIGSP